MDNTREKLIELFVQEHERCDNTPCNECEYSHDNDCGVNALVDHLIANGVTVQEWISVKDRKPENDYGKHWKERRHYLVRLQNGIMVVARYGYKDYGWWIDSHDCVLDKERYREVTHWMPLP